jgi:hypothetical protein
MTTKMIFSTKRLYTKVIENFLIFLESITQESEFICGIYYLNTELDRDNFEQDEMMRCKRT